MVNMKTTISVTVDLDVFTAAKGKISNVSRFVNTAFKAIAELPDQADPADINKAKELLAQKAAEMAVIQKQVKSMEDKEKEAAEEQYDPLGPTKINEPEGH